MEQKDRRKAVFKLRRLIKKNFQSEKKLKISYRHKEGYNEEITQRYLNKLWLTYLAKISNSPTYVSKIRLQPIRPSRHLMHIE